MTEHVVVVDGIEARSVADCPHKLRSPEGMAWCRDFASTQANHTGFRAEAKAAADARIERLGLKPANPMADMLSSLARVPTIAAAPGPHRAGFSYTHYFIDGQLFSAAQMEDRLRSVANWTVSISSNTDALSALLTAFRTSPVDRSDHIRTIAGKPAGLKAKTVRRHCVRHPKNWADSCRKCAR